MPLACKEDLIWLTSSSLLKGPMRTRCNTMLSADFPTWTEATTPSNASSAFILSASPGFLKDPV